MVNSTFKEKFHLQMGYLSCSVAELLWQLLLVVYYRIKYELFT